jgi:hypothetical protein
MERFSVRAAQRELSDTCHQEAWQLPKMVESPGLSSMRMGRGLVKLGEWRYMDRKEAQRLLAMVERLPKMAAQLPTTAVQPRKNAGRPQATADSLEIWASETSESENGKFVVCESLVRKVGIAGPQCHPAQLLRAQAASMPPCFCFLVCN